MSFGSGMKRIDIGNVEIEIFFFFFEMGFIKRVKRNYYHYFFFAVKSLNHLTGGRMKL